MNHESRLKISIAHFPPWSIRAAKQLLYSLPLGEFQRTINGDLLYLNLSKVQKFYTKIICSDNVPPAYESFAVGTKVNISCIAKINQKFSGPNCNLIRTAAEESIKVFDAVNNTVVEIAEIKNIEDNGQVRTKVILNQEIQDGWVSFCPKLIMLIQSLKFDTKEWNNQVSWAIEAMEV